MRVLIADDQEMLREVFDAMLSREQMLVTLAHDLESALIEIARSVTFDLILLDYHMPGMDGLNGVRRALEESKGARVALMSGNLPQHIVRDALRIGAAGFLPKKLPAKSYVSAIRSIASGEQLNLSDADAGVALPTAPQCTDQRLTSREALVLQQLETGKSVSGIATELGLKEITVNFVVKTLCRKFETQDSAAAVECAKKAGLL